MKYEKAYFSSLAISSWIYDTLGKSYYTSKAQFFVISYWYIKTTITENIKATGILHRAYKIGQSKVR